MVPGCVPYVNKINPKNIKFSPQRCTSGTTLPNGRERPVRMRRIIKTDPLREIPCVGVPRWYNGQPAADGKGKKTPPSDGGG